MALTAAVIPTTLPASTLGALIGPLGTLAAIATLVTLAVLLVGLLNEHRDARQRARGREEAIQRVAAPPARHAA